MLHFRTKSACATPTSAILLNADYQQFRDYQKLARKLILTSSELILTSSELILTGSELISTIAEFVLRLARAMS